MEIDAVAGPKRQITPTDVAQFIRLDQCQRYLRLRLFQRNGGSGFMKAYGVVPQSIPPLLTRSGAQFEDRVEGAVKARFVTLNCATDESQEGNRPTDNALVARKARDLAPGESIFLFQPRLAASLGDWNLRGDVDILRLERDLDGTLQALIADMKSSTSAKVEHRLQVAFYHEMLAAVLAEAGVACEETTLAILYRGPAEGDEGVDAALREEQEAAAEQFIGERVGLLEVVADRESYVASVRDLVTGPGSTAERIADTPFEDLPFALNYKCDGCMFNEFCMRWSAEHDDLSLLPYLTPEDKSALQRNGVTTTREVAALKDLRDNEVVPGAGKEELVRKLSTTWPVGPRLDELVLRARRYRRWKGDPLEVPSYIPSKGYGSLPYSDAKQNPNLIRVYIDAQHDYLQDRVYMVGALVVASEGGKEVRRHSIVHLADGPPASSDAEEALFVRWVDDTLRALVEIAAPDAAGEAKAPIHLIFWNRFDQRVLLEGLARHFERILGATPLYDFLTQVAGFDSAVATFMDEEIRELKNYPMVCQSLQAVAAYLRFDWNRDVPYREIFRTRLFDFWSKFDWEDPKEVPWYLGRARFNSQIPLEYAYAAWDDLPQPLPGKHDPFAPYRDATVELLAGFQGRRLDALEHVAHDFKGNRQTEKTAFSLPDLAGFQSKAPTLAHALQEFLTLERHVELSDWKTARLASPERRVLAGITWIARYREEDQTPEVAERNRENYARWARKDEYESAARALNPDEKPMLTREQKAETKWNQNGMPVRLWLDRNGVDCDLDQMLAFAPFRQGDRVVVAPRTIVDSRLPVAERVPITPPPKRLLWGVRADVVGLEVERDMAGRAIVAWINLELANGGGSSSPPGYAFGAIDMPFVAGERYTLDEDPNAWYEYFQHKTIDGLIRGGTSPLYDPLSGAPATVSWSEAAVAGQRRFLEGLEALQHAGALHGFEPSKCDYIGFTGKAPILLVQGPPGTGKSYSTAFALFARLQGAMAAERPFRVFLTCKTHAATDVLLRNVAEVQEKLRALWQRQPAIMDRYFDRRLLTVPLFRIDPKDELPHGVSRLLKKVNRPPGMPDTVTAITDRLWCVVGVTPAGTYRALLDRFKELYGHAFCDCLILDEASQMNLPEAIMAALPLKEDGQLIVVGDHRQMPPIIKHNWDGEPRRTFKEFQVYQSLFHWLLGMNPPMIKFAESFRLHADMAEFLRREIYVHDGIPFYSRQHRELPPGTVSDPFVASVLRPEFPIVTVVHDEAQSLVQNSYEQALITPVLEALHDRYLLDPVHGMGVVVPHRAQRAALQEALPMLTQFDERTGAPIRYAVDTVERFQGDERDVIMVSATESDPQYLLLSSEFLLDPRRLTVALSRAKRKMILVASRSVFSLFSTDEETFANARLWKNLLRYTCTERLWEGERDGHRVQVWGNVEEPYVPMA